MNERLSDLAQALRRAEAAHGEHEKRTGVRDQSWPDWYAEYMRREQSGEEVRHFERAGVNHARRHRAW